MMRLNSDKDFISSCFLRISNSVWALRWHETAGRKKGKQHPSLLFSPARGEKRRKKRF
jgi:hypothetical protein